MNTESEFVEHIPCGQCGSSDANSLYDDGHQHCFACGTQVQTGGRKSMPKPDFEPASGTHEDLRVRGISSEICRKFNYMIGTYKGKTVQIADYRDGTGKLVGQKLRFADKQFVSLGSPAKTLFGRNLWPDTGKRLVITEGELDALSYSEVTNGKWPVVSVPNAQSAKKAIRENIEWINGFEEVVFAFDMDEPGQLAAQECADEVDPGRAKIASFPVKDLSDMLQSGRIKDMMTCIYNARTVRPDGIINGNELWDKLQEKKTFHSVSFPFKGLNNMLMEFRTSQIVTLTAGSGVGKSEISREVFKHILDQGETIGLMMLEEDTTRTALGFMGLEANTRLHLYPDALEKEVFKLSYDKTMGTGRMFLYEHFGSTEIDNILNRVKYLNKACGCRWIMIDHLSILVSGIEGDERRMIDQGMTKLRTLVQQLDIGVLLVSHLRRPPGDKKSHEEGGTVSLSQLRGSHAIAQLSDVVIGAERNQQGEHPNITRLKILKSRLVGSTGYACSLLYDEATGRLSETTEDFDDDDGNGEPDF